MSNHTRTIVYSGVLAAAYVVLTLALAPISFFQFQFRVSEFLKPAVLWNPVFAVAFGVGTFLANLTSPFGAWDFVAMAFVDALAALACWRMRRHPVVAVTAQAVLISAGVAVFPLHFGGGLPILPSFVSVLASQLILLVGGYYLIWRKAGPTMFGGTQ
jgi:uncharacterized membrane protein